MPAAANCMLACWACVGRPGAAGGLVKKDCIGVWRGLLRGNAGWKLCCRLVGNAGENRA